jgi:hypothetical protein
MEEIEELKKQVKTVIDGIFPLIGKEKESVLKLYCKIFFEKIY